MKKSFAMRNQIQGFSLIELTVTLLIGFGVTAGVLLLVFRQTQAQQQTKQLADLQDAGQYALQTIIYDLAMAGFMGHVPNNITVNTNDLRAPQSDCGAGVPNNQKKLSNIWAYQANQSLEFLNNAPSQNGKFACLPTVQKNSDILAIRRVKSQKIRTVNPNESINDLLMATTYLMTSKNQGYLFTTNSTTHESRFNQRSDLWQYMTQIYAILPHSAPNKNDNIPTLCRFELKQNNWKIEAENCLAMGVENIQMQWGIDANQDGQIERYSYAPTPDELLNVTVAHISLLARALTQDKQYKNQTMSYQLADEPTLTINNDHYRRTVYRASVLIPNQSPNFTAEEG